MVDSPTKLSYPQHQVSRLRHIRNKLAHNPCIRTVHSSASVLDLALRAHQPTIHTGPPGPVMDTSAPHHSRRHTRKHIPLVTICHSDANCRLSIRTRYTCCYHKPQRWHRPHTYGCFGVIQHVCTDLQHHLVANLQRGGQAAVPHWKLCPHRRLCVEHDPFHRCEDLLRSR
jgi:hypothetical protein